MKRKSLFQKSLYTLMSLLIIRILYTIPTPGIDMIQFQRLLEMNNSLGILSLVTGNSFSNLSIMALGISTYITANIIMQMLIACSSYFQGLQQGSKKEKAFLDLLTIFFTIFCSICQGYLIVSNFGAQGLLLYNNLKNMILVVGIWTFCAVLLSLYAKWMVERTDLFIGNGISLILVSNILLSYSGDLFSVWKTYALGQGRKIMLISTGITFLLIFLLLMMLVFLKTSTIKIPLIYGSTSTEKITETLSYLPVKLCPSGVVPAVFTATFFSMPVLLREKIEVLQKFKWIDLFDTSLWFDKNNWYPTLGCIGYVAGIIFFSLLYQELTKPVEEMANELRQSGAVIPDVLPGGPTVKYLSSVRTRYILQGSVLLSVIVILPIVISNLTNVYGNMAFIGTTAVITVDVILDTTASFKASKKIKKL